MTSDTHLDLSTFCAADIENHRSELGALMHACVHDGASIGYVLPWTEADSEAFWRTKVLPGVQAGALVLLVARQGGRIVGSVQLAHDMPPNQPHRADVRKLIVHPGFRRQGVAQALMGRLEMLAGELGRTLLVLDTRTGDKAEPLYTSLGYRTVGVIPGYCLDPYDGRLDSTTIMYKALPKTPVPALLIIDMQNCMASAAAGIRNNPLAEQNIARLLQAWRAAGATVVHVRHISLASTSLFAPGQPGVDFQGALAPLPGEHVVEKNVPDAFMNTGLERWLRVRGLDSVVVAGVSTNNSVESSVRTAGNLGFRTVVVADATFAFEKTDYAGVHRSADEVHAMSLANLDGEYASVTHTQALLKDLPASD